MKKKKVETKAEKFLIMKMTHHKIFMKKKKSSMKMKKVIKKVLSKQKNLFSSNL